MRRLRSLADRRVAAHSREYFKAGRRGYGEGDRFLGIRVPVLRRCCAECRGAPRGAALELLESPFHEARLLAILMLVERYGRAGDADEREKIYRAFIRRAGRINNWDLVDCSAPSIVGEHLYGRDTGRLLLLARSKSPWERRMAVVATLRFIRGGDFSSTLRISRMLLRDGEDLVRKAVGWMLREVWKRDPKTARGFLARHADAMPRTMLRYAVERMPARERRAWMRRGRAAPPSGRGVEARRKT